MAAAPAMPGAAFAGRALVLKTIPAGDVWRRMYETRFPDPLGWGPGLSRFSDPTGRAHGVVYLGASASVAFVETTLRDAADGRGDDFVLDQAEIDKRSPASIRVRDPLRLVDLTQNARLRMGVPSDVVGASDQTLARAWSAGFHGHGDKPDGVYYGSRLNEQFCIALYDRALVKVDVISAPRLWDCGVELAAILDEQMRKASVAV
jgi:hypothetical protein